MELLVLFIAPLLAGLIAFKLKNLRLFNFDPIISFSGGIIFGGVLLHLIPEIFSHQDGSNLSFIVLALLVGFYFQMSLEHFAISHSHKDHGHDHHHHLEQGPALISLLIGFSIHAFIEGLPLDLGHSHAASEHLHSGGGLYLGIVVHKLPAAFALSAMMLKSGAKKSTVLLFLLIFCAMSPLGMMAGSFISASQMEGLPFLIYFEAFVTGAIVHIALAILMENTEGVSNAKQKLIAAIIGSLLVLLLSF